MKHIFPCLYLLDKKGKIETIKDYIMGLFQSRSITPLHNLLRDYYLNLEEGESSPFQYSIESLMELEKTSRSNEELAYYLMEEVIFNSLLCTYMEHIMLSVKETPNIAQAIIERFYQDQPTTEKELGEQTQAHANYVQNFGKCEGCPHCENHGDLEELIHFWEMGDLEFFKKLFLSMNIIQISFNYILQDFIPKNINKLNLFEFEEILKFREFIVAYSDNRFEEIY